MGINPQRLEDEYQFWATTDGFGNKVQDVGGDGGPRRGGKAKYTMSKVFADRGETLTETNISEDGSETKVVKKTPSDLLKNETFLSDDMDLSYESIASPPAEVVATQQSASPMIQFAQTAGLLENTPELAEVNKKVLTDMANSMGISLAELAQNKEFIQTFGGRYDSLINAAPEEYKGPGEIVSQIAWDDLHDGQTLGQSITGDPGNRESSIDGYSDYQTTFSNGLIVQDATTMVDSDDDKAYWNSETQTLDDPEGNMDSYLMKQFKRQKLKLHQLNHLLLLLKLH